MNKVSIRVNGIWTPGKYYVKPHMFHADDGRKFNVIDENNFEEVRKWGNKLNWYLILKI